MTRGAHRRITKADLAPAPLEEFDGDDAALEQEVERLIALNRAEPQAERERLLLHLRNLLAIRRLENGVVDHGAPEPEYGSLPSGPLIEIGPRDLNPRVLRAGILRGGCVLVRGLVDRDLAQGMAQEIERCFIERARHDDDRSFDDRYYVPFEHDPRRGVRLLREWIKEGGGVLAVDSPRLSFQIDEMFRRAALPQLVAGYLGGQPLISGDQVDAAQGRALGERSLAPGRQVHGPGQSPEPMAHPVSLRPGRARLGPGPPAPGEPCGD